MLDINLSFSYPLLLLLIIPFLLFLFIFYFKKSSKSNAIFVEDLLFIYKKNSFNYKVHLILIFIIFIVFIFILAKPFIGEKEVREKKNGIDIEIVFDLSYSMMATDLKPTRLDVAKKVLSNFITNIKSDRIGIIVFSGKPFNGVPLTFDYRFIKLFINNLYINTINRDLDFLQGTAIGDSLLLAIDYLSLGEKDREKIIILITDGDSNKGIKIETAINYAKKKNIKIYTIGIGGDKKTFLEISNYGITRQVEVLGINENILKGISIQTGGKYFRAKTEKEFESILLAISKLEKNEIEITNLYIKKDKNTFFIYLLLFLFCVYFSFNLKKILILN